jgi:hypothetical protein
LLTTRSRFFHEVKQEIEYLRFDRHTHAGAAQLLSVGIKYMIRKEKLHVPAPAPRRRQETNKRFSGQTQVAVRVFMSTPDHSGFTGRSPHDVAAYLERRPKWQA